jgi:hypothetical protein
MSIARGEKQSLLGFDENAYAPNSLAERRTIRDIADEHQAVRQASIHLFKHFPLETLNKIGVANKSNVSVRALGFIIAGHEMHHLETLKERYF